MTPIQKWIIIGIIILIISCFVVIEIRQDAFERWQREGYSEGYNKGLSQPNSTSFIKGFHSGQKYWNSTIYVENDADIIFTENSNPDLNIAISSKSGEIIQTWSESKARERLADWEYLHCIPYPGLNYCYDRELTDAEFKLAEQIRSRQGASP